MSSDVLLVRTSARSASSQVPLVSGAISERSSAHSRKQKKVVLQDDEFMAAAIGDLEWLKHALKKKSIGRIEFDKNVCTVYKYFRTIIHSLRLLLCT